MTVMEVLRRATPTRNDGSGEPGDPRWLPAMGAGATAALLSLLTTLVIVGAVGPLAARASVDWGDTFGTGAALWLLAGGSRLHADGVTIAFTPLLATALLFLLARRWAARSLPDGPVPRLIIAAWLGGYAAVAGLAWLLTLAGPARPIWWSMVLPVLILPGLALASVQTDASWRGWLRAQVPDWARAAVRPAARGVTRCFVVGALVVLIAVGFHTGPVLELYDALRVGPVDASVLTLAQLLALPNLALWALGFLAGPGFTVTEGALTTLSGSSSGLMPMVPVLGALPQPGPFPFYVRLLILVPILLGVFTARRAINGLSRLAPLRAKAAAALTSTTLCAVLVGVIDGVAGGSLGQGKLVDIGVSASTLTLALALTMGIGAAFVIAVVGWRQRR